MDDVNAGAREWALGNEDARGEPRSKDFADIVRAIDDAWLLKAHAMACGQVGPDEAEDAISITWEKVLTSFDGQRGMVEPFFFRVLKNVCVDMQRSRKRKVSPLPGDDALPVRPEHDMLAPNPEDGVIELIDYLPDRITAAIAVLDLTREERRMLRLMLDEQAGAPDDPPDSGAAARKRKERLRRAIDELAHLTTDEKQTVSLLRRSHTVAAARAAAPDLDVLGLHASARRKVLALFGIETETED